MSIGIDIYQSPTDTLTILTSTISTHIEVRCWHSRFREVVKSFIL